MPLRTPGSMIRWRGTMSFLPSTSITMLGCLRR